MSPIVSKNVGVLLVDDSPMVLFVLEDILVNAGFEVLAHIATGKALRAAISRHLPDVILLDHHLPDCKGLDLLKFIRAEFPNIIVIMISSESDPVIEARALRNGAAAFIHKPFFGQQVIQKIELAIKKRGCVGKVIKRGTTAVIADDSEAMRELLKRILLETGVFVLAEAENGQQACEFVSQHQPDLVCLDIEMPVMTGLEALSIIHNSYPTIKKIMVSSKSSSEFVTYAFTQGAQGFIVKPYAEDKVKQELIKLLGR